MKANKILESTLLDILFENRNKAYGAYELRTNYPFRMRKAIIVSFSIIVLLFVGLSLYSNKDNIIANNNTPSKVETTLHTPKEDVKKKEQVKIKVKKGTPAKNSPRNPPLTKPMFVEDVKDATVNNPNLTNNPNGNPNILTGDGSEIIGDSLGTDAFIADLPEDVIKPTIKDTFVAEVVTLPSYKASYVGGWDAFSNYLQKNLEDEALEDNMDKKITMSFFIEADGTITNVKAEGSDDQEFANKAKKVFEKMKKWKPAMESGSIVRTFRVIPLTIVLPE